MDHRPQLPPPHSYTAHQTSHPTPHQQHQRPQTTQLHTTPPLRPHQNPHPPTTTTQAHHHTPLHPPPPSYPTRHTSRMEGPTLRTTSPRHTTLHTVATTPRTLPPTAT
eukprot:7243113-Alexandrium_andersonii.AAC.1